MTTASDSPSSPRPFTIHGPIRLWDPTERRLRLGERDLWLAATVANADLPLGTQVTVKGHHHEAPDERWVVELLTVPEAPEGRHRPIMRGNPRRP